MLQVLLSLIFIRPFISSFAFPYLNSLYSAFFLIFLASWVIIKKPALKKISFLKYPLILFCLALTISIVFSSDKLNSIGELYKYISGLLLFLIAASLEYEDKIKVIHAMIITGLVISILAIYQYFFGFRHILDYISKQKLPDASFALDYISRKRVFFPFVTPNTLAGYLIMVTPLTLISKQTIWLLIPLTISLFLTQSLGAFMSIFLGMGIYFCLQGKFKKRMLLILLGLFVMVEIIFILRMETQKQHIQPIFSASMRLTYWQETINIIKSHPIVGIGPGNFDLPQSRYAHNSYLQLWAEMGILGMISFLWLIISLFKLCFENPRILQDRTLISSLITASIVFLAHNLIDFTFFLPEVSSIWWGISGLILTVY